MTEMIDSNSDPTGSKVEPVRQDSRKKALSLVVAIVTATGMAWALWSITRTPVGDPGGALISNANAATGSGGDQWVAVVDNHKISESEIEGLLSTGLDKAIVVDRYINKVLAAEKAAELYPKEAVAAERAARREVLATLYTTKRMAAIRSTVSDAEVKDFYNKNVLDENYKQWKISYYLSSDARDVRQTLADMKEGDKKALAQLKPLVEGADGYAYAAQLPYNLGRMVGRLPKGAFSDPLPLRNGFLVLRVDDIKQTRKPSVDDLKAQIVESIAVQKFNKELEQARRQAKVELG